jgi:lipopolysaccharide/colanic/teichoic acid biosynthesis glycosyltransferase
MRHDQVQANASELDCLSNDFRLGSNKRFIKRVFDLLGSVVMLMLAAPLMLLVALASLIESSGKEPILCHRNGLGYGGKTFYLYERFTGCARIPKAMAGRGGRAQPRSE